MRKNPFYRLDIDWGFWGVMQALAYCSFVGMFAYGIMYGFKSPIWVGGALAVFFVGLMLANLYHYHILTTRPTPKPPKTPLNPHLVSFSFKLGGLSHFEILGQKYRIVDHEYKVLFRSPKSPPNEWVFDHWDGAWVVLRNTQWCSTTCAILPKHIEKVS